MGCIAIVLAAPGDDEQSDHIGGGSVAAGRILRPKRIAKGG